MTGIARHTAGRIPWRIVLWGMAAALLALPAVAMQLTEEVDWTAFDFVFAGIMIGGTGLLLELTVRSSPSWAYRGGVAVALAAAFLLIWVNGAVGIIGDEDNPANLSYLGVILLSLAGAFVARLKPEGMARAMIVAAAAVALIALVAFAAGIAADEPPGRFGVLVINGFFAAFYLGSALLFAKAAREGA